MTASLSEQIRRLAGRTTGMTTDQIHSHSATAVGTAANKLVAKGQLFKVKVHRRQTVYFIHPGLADALVERLRAVHDARLRWAHTTPQGARRAPWSDSDPAVVPAGLVVQVCPAFTPRYAARDLPGIGATGLQRGRVMRPEAEWGAA